MSKDRFSFLDGDEAFISLLAANTLTSATGLQPMFDRNTGASPGAGGGGGALAVPTGIYRFECMGSVSSMSATSGNAAFNLLGNGTAGLSIPVYQSMGIDNAANALGNWQNVLVTQAATPASLCNAGTNTTLQLVERGMFRVTTPGTIIPSLSLVTAAAAVVAAGSWFSCRRLGSHMIECAGPWS